MKDKYPDLFEQYGDILTITQLCDYLQVSKATAYRLLQSRNIRGKLVGHSWRIPAIKIAEYLEKR